MRSIRIFPKERLKTFYDQFISLKGDPKDIAMAMAVGVFVGLTPTMPFHTIIIIILTGLLRQNFTAAYLGSWLVANPLTVPVLYMTEYELGRIILGKAHCEIIVNEYSFQYILELGWEVYWPLLFGGLMLAPVAAIPAYYITYRTIKKIRSRGHHADAETSA